MGKREANGRKAFGIWIRRFCGFVVERREEGLNWYVRNFVFLG